MSERDEHRPTAPLPRPRTEHPDDRRRECRRYDDRGHESQYGRDDDDRRDRRRFDDRYADRRDGPSGGTAMPSSRTRVVGRGVARSAGAVARMTAGAGRSTLKAARRASNSHGAGESGLGRLIEVHAFSSAGDAAVAIGLAGTVFFAAPGEQAKTQTLLFLLLTMLPFAIVAPLIGPVLDRLRHGRRWAIGGTLAIRAFFCWVLAGAVAAESTLLFPVAMCVLVSSKAYLVSRSAATPRLLPDSMTLVKANSRLSLAGVVGAVMAGALAGGAAKFGGSEWALRVAFVLFTIGTILAILLPPRVDSTIGEKPAPMFRRKTKFPISGDVISALRANAGLRWLSGFLTLFMAFLMRAEPFPGWENKQTQLLALVLGAAGLGNALGTVMGNLMKVASPRIIVLVMLIVDAAVVVFAALNFRLWTAVLVALVAGVGQQLGKLALDSLIQDRVPEHMRTSVFGRSETLLQLSWVIGGIIAVAIPTNAHLGMYLSAAVLVVWAVLVLWWHTGRTVRSGNEPYDRVHDSPTVGISRKQAMHPPRDRRG
ncbi:MFS transporter [Calidifontibacter indicus]|uniref:Putative MFS family arabinose efflux permease n=1 Tax=Calidifontibacter indicus TaxID=419650 RepID=A0A3D9UPY9_9MICO|nr:MFS transporter [Calidifontibacter indicus]REF31387.1 putative MFS family arabinose efflux permease [Calidifontibacter indicus]